MNYLTKNQVDIAMQKLKGAMYLAALIQWRTGLRVSEMLALTPADVDFASRTLTVQSGKGSKRRTVPLHLELSQALRFVNIRDSERFVSCTRSTVYRNYVRAGIPGTHALRHSAARHWLNQGRPVHHVQKVLGHARLEETLKYLELVSWDASFMDGIE